ncbi:hypothetical protein K8374_19840 [Pseudomonas sp. p1(2021b)]|uniref:hypothetical protein n=1 Tax=Pseudomonas sp. p1(2021b) TaxID=2874628 RepID=UPI001CCAAD85|nr:hypothetical protein [Pseudomonas sp. p1(2021b)]UBM24594.1 hypothetical protein K8374_19840 [Pseudomonas sp. p1(2021b)]
MKQETHSLSLTISSVTRHSFYTNAQSEAWDIRGTLQGLPAGSSVDLFAQNERLASDTFRIRQDGDFFVNAWMGKHQAQGDGTIQIVAKTFDRETVSNTVTAKLTPNPLPTPTIKTTTAHISTVTVQGTTELKQPNIEIMLAGQTQVTRPTSQNTWEATFNNVPEGTHTLSAIAKDPLDILKGSTPATVSVEVSHKPADPLRINAPAEGATVGRIMNVSGNAANGTGPIKVSVGGGAENTALLQGNYWAADVISAGTGQQTIRAENEMTGEVVTRTVEVASTVFGITRAVRSSKVMLHLEGYGVPSTPIMYRNIQGGSEFALDVKWVGNSWSYHGQPEGIRPVHFSLRAQNETTIYQYDFIRMPARRADLISPQDEEQVGTSFKISALTYPDTHSDLIVIDKNDEDRELARAPNQLTTLDPIPWEVTVGPLKPGTYTLELKKDDKSIFPPEPLVFTVHVK